MKKKLPRLTKNKYKETAIPSDVLGSYTGRSKDGEQPVQDADDL